MTSPDTPPFAPAATPAPAGDACSTCAVYRAANLKKLGVSSDKADFVIALAGNPNTGKSTVFNSLTGLRQHTGNWPGKTVSRAEGAFEYDSKRYKMVDLPGTYSLLSTSLDEEIARNFLLFGQPDVTVVVVDATRLERNLNGQGLRRIAGERRKTGGLCAIAPESHPAAGGNLERIVACFRRMQRHT